MEPKRLYRSESNRMIAGVCGGLEEYFNIDPSLVRLATVILCCAAGTGIFAYLVAAIIIPNEFQVK